MKISKFNVVIKEKDYLIIYNTLSSGVLRLESKYKDEYEDIEKNFVLKKKTQSCIKI